MTKSAASLRDLTVKQLRAIASRRHVTLRTQARKVEIVAMLRLAIPAGQLARDVRGAKRKSPV